MTCHEVRGELELYLLGESGRSAEIQRHLDGCAACTRECGRAAAMLETLDRELSLPVAEGLADRIVARVRRPRRAWWVAAAAVLAAAAVIGFLKPARLDGIRATGSFEVVSARRLAWKAGTVRVEVERRAEPAVVETPSGEIRSDEGTFEVRDMKTSLAVAVLAGMVTLAGRNLAAGETAMLGGEPVPVKQEAPRQPPPQDPPRETPAMPPKEPPSKQDPPKQEPVPPPVRSEGLRIAVVDLKKCFDPQKSLWAREFEATLNKVIADMESDLAALDKRIRDLNEQIRGIPDRNSQLFMDKAKDLKIAEIQRELTRRMNQTLLQDRRRELANKVYGEISAAVSLIAVQEGYDFVLRMEEPALDEAVTETATARIVNRVVLYAGERFDITGRVIERVNQSFERKK